MQIYNWSRFRQSDQLNFQFFLEKYLYLLYSIIIALPDSIILFYYFFSIKILLSLLFLIVFLWLLFHLPLFYYFVFCPLSDRASIYFKIRISREKMYKMSIRCWFIFLLLLLCSYFLDFSSDDRRNDMYLAFSLRCSRSFTNSA